MVSKSHMSTEHFAKGEPCLIPVFPQVRQTAEFWLDRQIDSARPPSVLQPGTYITDEAFLVGLHRAPLSPGGYRVRAKLLLGDSEHIEESSSEWTKFSVVDGSRGEPKDLTKLDGRRRNDLIKALRELRREVIHEILNCRPRRRISVVCCRSNGFQKLRIGTRGWSGR
jgi:hypothetical protein